MKCTAKKKCAESRIETGGTGGGRGKPINTDDVSERIVTIAGGETLVSGIPRIEEFGVPESALRNTTEPAGGSCFSIVY